ncbi:39S ribosomal protein L55, mitochondrial isoform X2 [Ailuropoda melanoleuca]|uniref:39S ribosomal protein L55, mitochondrial isoform X2 n=1 Tax=Ailuropoda melanoleuca TaxID=9646 RepID=UPI001493FD34|nr:39S ribosomal protein L55, mitochondrial isoform X2 [Ailuropoda melanoleuca]
MTSRRCRWRTGRSVRRNSVHCPGPFPSRLASGGRDADTRRCSGAQAERQAEGGRRMPCPRRRGTLAGKVLFLGYTCPTSQAGVRLSASWLVTAQTSPQTLSGAQRLVTVAPGLGSPAIPTSIYVVGRHTPGQWLTSSLHVPQGPSGGMATLGRLLGYKQVRMDAMAGVEGGMEAASPGSSGILLCDSLSLLWQHVVTGATPVRYHLHTSSWQADSNRALLTRVHRQAYARLYPVLLVKQDGSTIHIRYREPRRMLEMPVDLDTLSPEERRARFRKRETQLRKKKEEKPELGDDFDLEQYKRFWTKK